MDLTGISSGTMVEDCRVFLDIEPFMISLAKHSVKVLTG